MRCVRWFVVAAVVGTVLAIPTAAGANGGAYIEFNRTHYVAGDVVVGEAYVLVPVSKQHLFDRGPFHAYIWANDTPVREGRPIPGGAVRAGTFSVERRTARQFELEVRFRMPDLESAYYTISLCNDPCTISGFREQLTGQVSVVGRVREGELLTDLSRLQSRVFALRHEARRAERKVEVLEPALAVSENSRTLQGTEITELKAEIEQLEARLADGGPPEPGTQSAAGPNRPATRPLVAPWVAITLAGALLVLGTAATLRLRAARRTPLQAGP